jgi:SAM-dependent methyltransferase
MVISGATGAVSDYRCVSCMSILRSHGAAELCCHNCGRSFPVVNEIPVLTSRPRELLLVHLEEFRQAQAAWMEKQSRCSSSAKTNTRPGTSDRAGRMLHGVTQNLRLIGTFIKPIEDYLSKSKKQASTLIDWALAQNVGSAPQTMLPFFYQDWARTRDFEEAESLILSGLVEHRPDDKTIAILGAGACGLVSSTARHFRVVYGVDLSVPTLLIAQAVLRGHTIEVYVANAGWRCAQLTPPSQAQNEIRLIAADVGTLPFAKESLSAVVTQYLMDIAGDPLGVADEIQRVLKPGGIWVNFSNPFRIPGELPELGPPEPSELQELLAPLGLDIVKVQRTRFTLQNLDQIYSGGHRNAQEVHFFIARKPARSGRAAPENRFQVWNRRDEASWWQLVPRIVPGREIQIIRKQVFGPGGRDDRIEIGLNSVSFGISGEHTAFVEALFGQIDGQHTLRQVFGILASQGIAVSETEFRELVYSLLKQYCVITLSS